MNTIYHSVFTHAIAESGAPCSRSASLRRRRRQPKRNECKALVEQFVIRRSPSVARASARVGLRNQNAYGKCTRTRLIFARSAARLGAHSPAQSREWKRKRARSSRVGVGVFVRVAARKSASSRRRFQRAAARVSVNPLAGASTTRKKFHFIPNEIRDWNNEGEAAAAASLGRYNKEGTREANKILERAL